MTYLDSRILGSGLEINC